MANERITESIVRNHFLGDSLFKKEEIIFEEQASANIKIDKLLKNASKGGNGKGYPEFLIQYNENCELLIVVECKAEEKFHESENYDKYKDYAVDGALLYSSFLSKEYDVISIAVSGQSSSNLKVSHFLQLKGTKDAHKIFTDDKLLSLTDYLKGYKTSEKKFNQDFLELLKYAKTLNDKLHLLKVPESNRSLLISAALIALSDAAFQASYKLQPPKSLVKNILSTIETQLQNVQNEHIANIMTTYSFIQTHTILSTKENELRDIIADVDAKINNFIKTYKYFDTLGQFYIEFLRYANNDKGLGIVLTPPHITDLFCELANINKDSIVLDTCTGTGGFLISALRAMIIDAGGDIEKEQKIKSKQIIGVEQQHDIFSLLCSNMYIHGDGRSNLLKGSCFDENIKASIAKFEPNVGFLNPPYKASKNDIEELQFVINNLEGLSKGSLCIAIVPMLCATATSGNKMLLKKKLLEKHTLEGVFSMPNELFHNSNVSVSTCVMIFRAKEKHPTGYETYFGYWKDDGFIKIKNIGRTDFYNTWPMIKQKWVNNYRNKKEIAGHSIKKSVSAKNEWCAEAYMETDYSTLTRDNFIKNIKQYLTYHFNKNGSSFSITPDSIIDTDLKLNTMQWHKFKFNKIFKIKKGKRLTKKDQIDGQYPYVSSSSLNNGVDNYIGNDYTDENCITFACYGSIGEVFYQNEKVWVSDNANVFYVINRDLNPFTALFLVTILRLEQFRFSYGMTGKKERLETLNIKLPVDRNKEPDWAYIEKYMRSLPFSKSLLA